RVPRQCLCQAPASQGDPHRRQPSLPRPGCAVHLARRSPMKTTILDAGRNASAFWLGSAFVTLGVALHLPMFLMGRHIGYVLVGMPMDQGMYWGMAFILVGIACA